MKKFPLAFIVTSCIIHCAFSQNPLVKMWDKRFGGTGQEQLSQLVRTSDRGFIFAGDSWSYLSGGDKTQPNWNGNSDFWILKCDSSGSKQWDKVFGGLGTERLRTVVETTDGGYIVGGWSDSRIGGDRTQDNWDTIGLSSWDYWIVKIDPTGTKQWDKRFGGDSYDDLSSVVQTSDGGYILGGWSRSGATGDRTEANWDTNGLYYDYWLVKIDSIGNKLWDKRFGGTSSEEFYSISQTKDGGYILGGQSLSGLSGDKTDPGYGTWDYWIIKIDSIGTMQWDRCFGGSNVEKFSSLQQIYDGGYILGGISFSGQSGNKSQPNWDNTSSTPDYWIVKIDSLGNKVWDKDFGTIGSEDEMNSVVQTSDSGFLLLGSSYYALPSGNKTETNLGQEQMWAVKTDPNGILQWDKTIFTNGHDEGMSTIQSNDGCYVFAGYTNARIAGYKSEENWDTTQNSWDYWMVKFCDTLLVPISAFSTSNQICSGSCIDFLNLSINATSYQWSFPGAIPNISTATNPTNICYSTPGSYDVQLIATNTTGSNTLLLSDYITVFPAPPPQAISQSGDTLFANTGTASYQWYFNGNVITGATNYFYVASQSGNYNVVATDSNGCEVEAVINDVLTNTPLAAGFLPLAVYPNPVTDKFTIQNLKVTRGTAVEISIYNVLGEIVLTIPLPIANCQLPTCSIDVSTLVKGMYWLDISTEEKTIRSKFVKQ